MCHLRSPRIVSVLGAVTTDGRWLGLVMEYCAGGSLRAALDDESGVVTGALQRTWSADVALGMAFLYAQGVEHRDLKALNVLLTSDLRGKVTDFGLSRCDELKTALTTQATAAAGGAAGTPAFMAPELLEDNIFTEKSRRLGVRHRPVGDLGQGPPVARAPAGADHAKGRGQAATPARAGRDARRAPGAHGPRVGPARRTGRISGKSPRLKPLAAHRVAARRPRAPRRTARGLWRSHPRSWLGAVVVAAGSWYPRVGADHKSPRGARARRRPRGPFTSRSSRSFLGAMLTARTIFCCCSPRERERE